MNAFTFLVDAARRWPDAPASISASGTLSFRDLLDQAESVKGALFESGLRPGMGLGLVAENSPEFIVGLFAGLASGAVVMPLSPHLKPQEFSRILELVPLAAILHDGSLRDELPRAITSRRGAFNLSLRSREHHVRVAPGIPDAAVIRFTSGTTGSSKGVVLSHCSVFERTEAACEGLRLSAGDSVLWVLPMAYHFVVSILAFVRYGISIVIPSSPSPRDLADAATRNTPSLFYASPAVAHALLSSSDALSLPATMRVVTTSSGLSPLHSRAFHDRFGITVDQLYGLIEVGLPIGTTMNNTPNPGSVGRALPGYEVAILDQSGQRLPANTLGSLAVRGPGMFDAYLNPYRPAREVLVHGWFLTGDLAVQDENGEVTVKGREKSVINVSGNKVFPEEVEGVLCSFPGVRAARVYGVTRGDGEEAVVAEVVPQPDREIPVEALGAYAAERLSHYKLPARISIVSSIDMTDSGKVRRAA